MKKSLFVLAIAGSLLMSGSSSPMAPAGAPMAPAGERKTIALLDLIERVDRETILREMKILGVVSCRDGHKTRKVLWIENPWPFAYVEGTPERGDQWCTVEGFKDAFHAGGCPDRETTTYGGGSPHTAITLRRASAYAFAPLPSHLKLGSDSRINSWAFPDPEENHPRLALAHDSGFMDPAWTDAALARTLQGVKPDADAFARCYKEKDPVRCFGAWGPADGSYPRTGWMPDGSRRSRLLSLLYSGQLAREGPEGYRTSWQKMEPARGRGHTYYHLVPRDTGPETGHFLQVVYPDKEDAMKIGTSEIWDGKEEAPDAMGVVLMGIFRRPAEPGADCKSVRFMPPRKTP